MPHDAADHDFDAEEDEDVVPYDDRALPGTVDGSLGTPLSSSHSAAAKSPHLNRSPSRSFSFMLPKDYAAPRSVSPKNQDTKLVRSQSQLRGVEEEEGDEVSATPARRSAVERSEGRRDNAQSIDTDQTGFTQDDLEAIIEARLSERMESLRVEVEAKVMQKSPANAEVLTRQDVDDLLTSRLHDWQDRVIAEMTQVRNFSKITHWKSLMSWSCDIIEIRLCVEQARGCSRCRVRDTEQACAGSGRTTNYPVCSTTTRNSNITS